MGLACALAGVLLASNGSSSEAAVPATAPSRPTSTAPHARAAAATPGEAPPQPTPLVLSKPLRTHVLLAAGYAIPWLSASNAWVSSDGKSVAFFLTRESSSDDGVSSALLVKDVDTDAVVFEKVLFSTEESLQHSGPDLERLARARAWEALPFLEQREWTPLLRHELPPKEREFFSDACFEKQMHPKRSVSVGDLKISYQEPRVQISRRGKTVLDRRFSSWRVRQEGCAHASPSWLNGVFVGREQGVVFLELGFCGMDLCPEPPAAFHVLRIPSDKPRVGSPSSAQAGVPARVPFIGYETEGAARETLYVTGLPAISEDGTLVALAEVLADGARKDPNLLITVRRPQTQELVWTFPVLEPGEVSSARGSLPRVQALEGKVLERIRQANGYLGKTQWVPLAEQPVQPVVAESCQQAPAQTLRLPRLELTLSQGQLALKQEGRSSPVELKLAREGSSGEGACKVASRTFIHAAYVDESRGVVLLRLTTCGDEACPEQDGWYHALKLP